MDASAGILPGDRAGGEGRAGKRGSRRSSSRTRSTGARGARGSPRRGRWDSPEVYGVSAEHGIGVDELLDAIAARVLPEAGAGRRDGSGEDAQRSPRRRSRGDRARRRRPAQRRQVLARQCAARRGAGDRLGGRGHDAGLGATFSSSAGGRVFRLVDTAGIRRKAKTERGPEVLSVVQARKRIEECDVALLVLDASEGPPRRTRRSPPTPTRRARASSSWRTSGTWRGGGGGTGDREDGSGTAPRARSRSPATPRCSWSFGDDRPRGPRVLKAAAQWRRTAAAGSRRASSTASSAGPSGTRPPQTAPGETLARLYVAQTGAVPADLHARRQPRGAAPLLRGAAGSRTSCARRRTSRVAHPDLDPRPVGPETSAQTPPKVACRFTDGRE